MTLASDLGIFVSGDDCSPAFRSAMEDPAVSMIEFEDGRYLLDSQVALRSGITIQGSREGKTIFSPLETFSPRTHLVNALISTEPDSRDITIRGLRIDGAGIGAGSTATRIHNLVMRCTHNFLVEGVESGNSSGYAQWASGDRASNPLGVTERPCSGSYVDCYSWGSNVLYEQSLVRGVKLIRCKGDDGPVKIPGINTEACFHPWHGSEDVAHYDCSYKGSAGAGIAIASMNGVPLKNILFKRTSVYMTGGTIALITDYQEPSDVTHRIELELDDCELFSRYGNAANLRITDGKFRDTRFGGYSVGVALTEGSNVNFKDCDLSASNHPVTGPGHAQALRLEGDDVATTVGGSLRARGYLPHPFIKSSASTLTLGLGTILEPAS